MNFSLVEKRGEILGYEFRSDDHLIFFGAQGGAFEQLEEHYPHLKFCRLKQVHGDDLVEASPQLLTADAHWTDRKEIALLVATADCLPVLISHPGFVCSIHAGWRGIQNEIVIKTVRALAQRFGGISAATVFYGPHIHQNSFEVDLALAHSFQNQYQTYGGAGPIFKMAPQKNGKAYVNLQMLLRQQLQTVNVPAGQIHEFSADTKTDLRFASYRRQKENARRNLSFASRLQS